MSSEAARLSAQFHVMLAQLRQTPATPAAAAANAPPPVRFESARTQIIQAVASNAAAAAAAAASSGAVPLSKADQMRAYISANRNQGTAKAYSSGWAGFEQYLAANRLSESSFGAADVADYLRMRVDDMGVKFSTLSGDRAAIADRVKHGPLKGVTGHQLVVDMMHVLKTRAEASQPKQHVSLQLMRELIDLHEAALQAPTQQGKGPSWLRERDMFLLLVMMMGMLRESEAVALQLRHCKERELLVDGKKRVVLNILIPRSKTDQEGKGQMVLLVEDAGNPLCCPVRRYRRYLDARKLAGVESVWLFALIDGGAMAKSTPNHVLKSAIERANREAEARQLGAFRWGPPEAYGSHSLRRGGVTLARANGVSMLDIQKHGRWKSLTVFAYVGTTESERVAVTESFLRLVEEQQAPAESAAVLDEEPSEAARLLRAGSKKGGKKRAAAAAAASASEGESDSSDAASDGEALEDALFDEAVDAADEQSGKKKVRQRYAPARGARATGEKKRRKSASAKTDR
jgi:integrase